MLSMDIFIEVIFMCFFILATIFIIYFNNDEGKDERGHMIFAKASKLALFVLFYSFIGLTFYEKVFIELPVELYKSIIFYLIFGTFIIAALSIQYYREKE